MNLRQTHTFAVLELSEAAFKEIHAKLREAGYDHAFIQEDERLVIDMHGIAVAQEKTPGLPSDEENQSRSP